MEIACSIDTFRRSKPSCGLEQSRTYVSHLFHNNDNKHLYCNRWHWWVEELSYRYINDMAKLEVNNHSYYDGSLPAVIFRTDNCSGAIWSNGAVMLFEDDTICVWIDEKTRQMFSIPLPKNMKP